MRCALLLLLAGVVRAEDLEATIDRVVAAAGAGRTAELAKIAAGSKPDPWWIAEQVCLRGKPEAAAAFARAHEHPDLARLPEYVAWRARHPLTEAERKPVDRLLASRDAKAVVEMHVRLADETDVRTALADLRAGRAWRTVGHPGRAIDAFRRAAGRANRIGWIRLEGSAWNLAGNTAIRAQRSDDAVAAFRKALEVQRKRKDRFWVARNLSGLGVALRRTGDLEGAIEARESALGLQRDLGLAREAARSLEVLGIYWSDRGDASRARSLYGEAAAEYERLGLARQRASALDSLASVLSQLGDFEPAARVRAEALAIARRLDDRRLRARILGNKGIGLRTRGDFAGALDAYEASLRIKREVGDRRGVGITLSNLSSLYRRLGEYDRSIRLVEDTFREIEAISAPAERAELFNTAGSLYVDADRMDEARAHLEKGLEICRGSSLAAAEAKCLVNLAHLERRTGAVDAARRTLRKARALKERVGDPVGVAKTWVSEGQLSLDAGSWEEAGVLIGRGRALAEKVGDYETLVAAEAGLALVQLRLEEPDKAMAMARSSARRAHAAVRRLPATQAASTRSRHADVFAVGAAAALRTNDPESFLEFAEQGRAASLLEALGGEVALRATDLPAESREAEDDAHAARRRAVTELRRAVATGNRAAARAARDRLDEADEALMRVAERSQRALRRAASLVYPSYTDLDGLRGVLEDSEAFVLFAALTEGWAALVVTREQARLVRLGAIEDMCRDFASAASRPDADVPGGLAKSLLAPLGLEAKRLLICPDGVLGYLPLCVLAPDRELVFVPSASSLAVLRAGAGAKGRGVLAVGDPAYGEPVEGRLPALARLPASGREAKAIGDVALSGKQATRAGVLRALNTRPRWRALHFACHGRLDANRPFLSSLALAPTETDGGHLTVLDVYRMEVPADLVVLSACDTARGRFYRAEGVIGLTRAFMRAGAPRILSSLWKVDDEATRVLMVKFYEEWNAGRRPAAALLAAQAHVRKQEKKWRHPSYWAAWQLWGLPG